MASTETDHRNAGKTWGVPFTSETAAAAGRKGAETRKRNAAAREALKLGDSAATPDQVAALLQRYERSELGPMAAAVAMHGMSRLLAGDVPIRHAGDLAALVTALVDVARLEAGEATSHVIAARVNVDATADRVRQLQDQARQALSSGAVNTAPESQGVESRGSVPSTD